MLFKWARIQIKGTLVHTRTEITYTDITDIHADTHAHAHARHNTHTTHAHHAIASLAHCFVCQSDKNSNKARVHSESNYDSLKVAKCLVIYSAPEWTREISTVPVFSLAKQQTKERAWNNQLGKKTLPSSTHVQVSSGKLKVNRNLMWTKMTSETRHDPLPLDRNLLEVSRKITTRRIGSRRQPHVPVSSQPTAGT